MIPHACIAAALLGHGPVRASKATIDALEGGKAIPLLKKGRFYEFQLAAFGGEAGWFVLDTGGTRSYVTPKGLGAHTERGEAFLATSVNLGGYPVAPFELILDKKAGRASLDPDASAVIGADVLSRFRVGLDLRSRTMRIWPVDVPIAEALADWYRTEPGASSAALPRFHGLPLWSIVGGLFGTNLTVNGQTIGAAIDTGSESSLIDVRFQGGAFEGLRKLGEYPVRFYTGPARVERFDAKGLLSLGSIALPGERSIGRVRTPERAGSILGCDVLVDLRMLLDFPGRQIYARLTASEAERS